MKDMSALWNVDYVVKNPFSRPGYKLLDVRGIVVHWTANPGATDENHQKFFDGSDGGGGRYAGAHIFVDRDSATLIIPLDEIAYHANERACRISKLKGSIKRANDTYYGDANVTTIGIEMCVEKDGSLHPNTVAQTVGIVAELCKMYKLTANDVYRHYDITGKNCPAPWVSNPAHFTNFKANVAAVLGQKIPAPVVKPAVKGVSSKGPNFNTNSIVDFLVSVGENHSFANRSRLAGQYGIKGYEGSAAQNSALLEKLKVAYKKPAAAPSKPATSAPKGDMKTDSIVTYLNSIGQDSSYPAREKLAAKHGIKGYKGSAAQNLQLLAILRSGKAVAAPAPAKKNKYAGGNSRTDSVVDYLKSIKVDSSFNNRKKIAAELGIKGYEGTAAQNAALLKKMRG
jgi:N-acetylmuramoyl-L-alanine amidase